jgi:hypothetical protein
MVTGLVLAGKKSVLEGEGIEGRCSDEGTLLHIGNSNGKASDKPHGGPNLSGEEGRLILFPYQWSFEDKGIVYCCFNIP